MSIRCELKEAKVNETDRRCGNCGQFADVFGADCPIGGCRFTGAPTERGCPPCGNWRAKMIGSVKVR